MGRHHNVEQLDQTLGITLGVQDQHSVTANPKRPFVSQVLLVVLGVLRVKALLGSGCATN